MKSNKVLKIILAAALVNLAACSYIKSLFPDKEKDYQFTTEIKPLTLPSDLSDNPIFKSAEAADTASAKDGSESAGRIAEGASQTDDKAGAETAPAPEAGAAEPAPFETEPVVAEPVQAESEAKVAEPVAGGSEPRSVENEYPAEQPAKKKGKSAENIPVELVVYDDGESRLRISADTAKAWRLVGKALSRQSIEVISRNQEELSYSVQYDPDEKQAEDESLWDEVKFIFGGFETNDKEYQLKLIENNQKTDVAVLDQDGKPVSNGRGLRLLKLIQTTLRGE